MYLSRKAALLQKQGFDVDWINPRNLPLFIASLWKIRFLPNDNVSRIEVHSSHVVVLLLLLIAGVDQRCSFYDHNYSSTFKKRGGIYISIVKRLFPRFGSVVLVSEHLKMNYTEIFDDEFIERFEIEMPYIPLSSIGKIEHRANLSTLFEFAKNHTTYFINAAWKLVDDEMGNDLYGLENSLDVFLKTFQNSRTVGLVLIIGSNFKGRKELLEKKAANHDNILILNGDYDLCSVICAGRSILLRTTSTDGDSLSVREAIELDRRVIASNVVPRPSGVNTYAYGNDKELANLMLKLVE